MYKPGGWNCVGCVLVVNILFRYVDTHQKTIDEALEEICTFLPGEYGTLCDTIVSLFGDALIYYFTQEYTPDEVCKEGGFFCNDPQCTLFPSPNPSKQTLNDAVDTTSLHTIMKLVHKVIGASAKTRLGGDPSNHVPLVDNDNDRFSTIESFRGSSWRGKDCNDQSNTTYPGRKIPAKPGDSGDFNCNGISGVNPTTRKLYKDELCGQSEPRGVIVVGASAQAHFEIPPIWLDAAKINSTTYDDVVFAIQNEMDWPQRSWATGYSTDALVDSIYLQMWKRNHCNFKDYQNLGVNGASSNKIINTVKAIARNATTDYPALAFYATIGDDVCSQDKTLDRMTTPAQFYTNVVGVLNYLDSGILPMGSHLTFIGLVDGRILWDELHDKLNPVGRTYEEIYSWLACLNRNPCWQWLNPNETTRNLASQRAAELSAVFDEIIANNTFKHFDMAYLPFPLPEIIKEWTQRGGKVSDLIEAVDGFHPSQIGNYVVGGWMWQWLLDNRPSWVGKENPNNPTIEKLFGDQGGYY